MKINNHKLLSTSGNTITFDESPNHSGKFAEGLPDTIVIHYTAGSSLESSATWLKNPQASASAHIIVGKSGNIIQLVPFNKIAWHAGISQWNGRSGLNKYSIGIEIDNAGILEKRAEGYYTYFGKRIDDSEVVLATHKNAHQEQAWEAFNEQQIERVEELCLLLKEKYNITEIVGHDDVAPIRKQDPGPAFPLEKLRQKILFGRKEGEGIFKKGIVTANKLNIRTEPTTKADKVTSPLPKGTEVTILQEKEDWVYVSTGIMGWVHKKWVDI